VTPPGGYRVSMSTPQTDEPIGAVVHRLSEQIPELVRAELRLAQAEMTEKGKRAGVGVGLFSAAGVLALFGVSVLVATAVIALDLVWPLWLAALVVGVALLALAGVAALTGRRELAQATPPAPERAISGVKADVEAVKGHHA
jgi:uncharacterized membrane protein YqjE